MTADNAKPAIELIAVAQLVMGNRRVSVQYWTEGYKSLSYEEKA